MFRDILKRFLNGQILNEEEEKIFLKTVKTQATYAVNSIGYNLFRRVYSEIDEITDEAVILIINKKDTILKANENGGKIEYYIKLMIKNHIIDKLRKKTIQSDELDDEYSQMVSPKNQIANIEAIEFSRICNEILTKTEKEALCFELLEIKPENKANTSFGKAKSRAHKRIKDLVIEKKFTSEVVEAAIKKFFLSEICSEFVISNEVKK